MESPSTIRNRLPFETPALSVGVLTADLLSLGSEIRLLERAGVRVAHFDVMDGCFCPAITFGPPVVKAVKTSMWKDVHLLIDEPLAKLPDFVAAGADMITVQAEASRHLHRVFQTLGQMTNVNDASRGILRGVALNPGTPLQAIEPILRDVEMVFLLAVNPGWGGQGFIPATLARLAQVRSMILACGRDILLGVDGGVTKANVADIARAGADIIVTGSAVFDGKDAEASARFMLDAVAKAGAR